MNDFHESDRPPSNTMSYAFASPGAAEGTLTSMDKNRNEKTMCI
jgi:hypothetical protein